MLRHRNHAFALTLFVCVFTIWATPARSEDTEVKAAIKTEKVEPPIKANPKAAITTKQPDIPVDELRLLVKPLTSEELQNEAAAWQLLLKNKVKEISNAEIAVKRQNRSIGKQQEAAGALDQAKQALEEAEKAQKNAAPGSPEYEETTKKLEEAKQKLKTAQEAIQEVTETKKELKDDKTLNNALKQAEKTGELEQAKKTLDEAKKERENLSIGSFSYNSATQKIETLEQAIKAFEDAQEQQKGANPNSAEYKQATQKIEKATKKLKEAREAIKGSVTTGKGATEQSTKKLDEAASALQNTTIKAEVDTKIAGSSEVVKGEDSLNKKGQQLQKTADKLEQNAKGESALKNQLVATVTELQAARTAIVDRFNVILDELDRKGGDTKSYRSYIEAISKIEVDVKDTEGLSVRLFSWSKSKEGGLRWAMNIGKFVSIVLASVIVAQIFGLIISQILKLSRTSRLLRKFIVLSVKRGGIVVGILLALTALEVSLGPVLAVLGGASFVLAFALQSNLGNFASGLMLMVYKPFDVGDEVEVAGMLGLVDSISLANTRLKNLNSDLVTIPNNTVWNSNIINYTHDQIRRIKISIRSNYSNNIPEVRKLLVEIAKSHASVLETPAPSTSGIELLDSYVQINLRVWIKTSVDFWTTRAELGEMIHGEFEKAGISIAPSQDIRLLPASENKLARLTDELAQDSSSHQKIPNGVV